MLPTSKGIALTPQQWFKLTDMRHTIDDAIEGAAVNVKHRPGLSMRRNATHLRLDLPPFDEAGCAPENTESASNEAS